MKIQKKIEGGWGGQVGGRVSGGVKVDVNEELKFFWENSNKKKFGGGEGGEGGSGGGGSGWWGWFRVDVNTMLGIGVMWVMGDVNQE